jgi:hypothetical protein
VEFWVQTIVLITGSNALYFADANIAACTGIGSGFYCPPFTQNLNAVIQGTGGASRVVNFQVANAGVLFAGNPSSDSFANLAGPNPDPTSFDWGLPFFFGRTPQARREMDVQTSSD